jgi:vacuolar protein sorting-associated protein 53
MKDFDNALSSGTFKHEVNMLCDSCIVLDLMEFDARSELISWYCELQLKDYYAIFRQNPEVAGLADVSRRFAWLKRLLKNFDELHAQLFPSAWNVAECVTTKFCQETKKELSQILARDEREDKFDTRVLLAALEQSVDFEGKINSRFNPDNVYSSYLGWTRLAWDYKGIQVLQDHFFLL